MNNHIGGLFRTQESANLAYEALQKAGFATEDIHMLLHKPRRSVVKSMDVPIQNIAKNAFLGALVGGIIGAFVGWLVGSGTISLPYLEPGSAPREPLFVLMSVIWGLITGGLTGAILSVAFRLLRSNEKAEVMTREIEKRGVLVTVHAADSQTESKALQILQEHQAVEVGPASEKWDLNIWVSPNENETRASVEHPAHLR
jgi:gas vesicle protein